MFGSLLIQSWTIFISAEIGCAAAERFAHVHSRINQDTAAHKAPETQGQAAIRLTRSGGGGFGNAIEIRRTGAQRDGPGIMILDDGPPAEGDSLDRIAGIAGGAKLTQLMKTLLFPPLTFCSKKKL